MSYCEKPLSELGPKWEKYDARTYLSAREVPIGRTKHRVYFRIDGREGPYRVDRGGMCGWEAIDKGEGFATVRAAQVWVSSWVCAAVVQEDLCPRMTREEGSEP